MPVAHSATGSGSSRIQLAASDSTTTRSRRRASNAVAVATKRGTYRRTEETRATIIAVAWQVMLERGFYGMSIALVAEKSDMTRAGLMYHFPTKEHLLVGVMDSRFQANRAWFTEQQEAGHSVLDTTVEFAKRRVDDPETVTL